MRGQISAGLAASVVVLAGLSAAPVSAATHAGTVVVVGVPGLRWDDVSARVTPALWRLAGSGSSGALSVRSAGARTCPADGWVTLGAGDRAQLGNGDARCDRRLALPEVRPTADGGAEVPAVADAVRDNEGGRDGAVVGALGATVRGSGACTAAVGPGAALAAADAAGRVDVYADTPGPDLARLLSRCPLAVVEAGALAADPPDRERALTRADATIASVDATRPPGSTLLVVGSSDTGTGAPGLHVALAAGPHADGRGYGPGSLSSASTRRPPYVQLIDVAPTVLSLLTLRPPDDLAGQPWRVTTGEGTRDDVVSRLVDADRAAQAQRRTVPGFFALLGTLLLMSCVGAAIVLRRPGTRRGRRALAGTALALGAVPLATFVTQLFPWWRAGTGAAQLGVAVVLAALVATGVALVASRGPWARAAAGPAAGVAAVTAAVLVVDLVSGARLQMSSLLGYSPLVAGRFAGIGNVAFAVLATASLLAGAVLADRRDRRAAVAVVTGVGLVTVLADGAPAWGSDVGGVLALMPAFVTLGLLAAGLRPSPLRLAFGAVAGAAVVSAFGLLDYTRPAGDRTHLGRFVGQVRDGSAADVLIRKLESNLELLTTNALTLVVPVLAAGLGWLVLRPPGTLRLALEHSPAWRSGLVAVLVLSAVGFVTNDSGVAVPALAIAVALPLTVAVILRTEEDREQPGAAGARDPEACRTPTADRGALL